MATLPLRLTPEEIGIDKQQNVRKFKSDPEVEAEEIRNMALSLLDVAGQLQPVTVRETKKGSYTLLWGHRRRAAAMLINSGAFKSIYDPKKKGPFLLDAIVRDLSADEAKHAAIIENVHRKGFSPIELLLLIEEAREDNGWQGEKGTQKVADYLHVGKDTVIRIEKLASLPKNKRHEVHSGGLSVEAALAFLNVDPVKLEKVAADAKALAKADAQAKLDKAEKDKKYSTKNKEKLKKAVAKPKVEKQHVVKAARKNKALKVKDPRTKKEILDFFEGMTGAASAPVMADFAEYLVNTFAKGSGTEGTLLAKWDAIEAALKPEARSKQSGKEKSKAA